MDSNSKEELENYVQCMRDEITDMKESFMFRIKQLEYFVKLVELLLEKKK